MSDHQDKQDNPSRDAANIRLAIGLGLLAFGIYAGYILMHFLQ
ncbi:MAG: hypothetical protein R3318_06215 [Gammaproteobacteria bacterium]|nr:hypothetical protein [Gammaproteobacteria bacterium]